MVRMLFVSFFLIALSSSNELINNLKLDQVLILSRHNIRAPLAADLQVYSPNIWPKFNVPVGHLTEKGALLESFMGQYFTEWLESEGLLKGCPKLEDVFIYSNTKSRTRDTAKSFAEALFGDCNIPFYHNDNINYFDPLFLPIYHNNTEQFKEKIIEEMYKKMEETDLEQSYSELNRMLDIQNSDICKQNSFCDFNAFNDETVLEEGEEPNVNGPLNIGTSIIDTFLMSYYEGFPLEDVAWGQITTDEQWHLMTKITKKNLDVRFNITLGLKDVAGPLLRYMFDIFRSGTPKFTVLVGHDSNLITIVNALRFKEFNLRNQHEPFPIGSKLVFQKWSKGENSFLKVEYIYQTFSQIRNSVQLSLEQPPEKVLLQLKDCETDKYGFCPWNDFLNIGF